MGKKFLFIIPGIIFAILFLVSFSGDNSDSPNGAPAGYTGSPGDGKNCIQCHGGSPQTVTGWITSSIPAQGYTPGTTYTVTVTVTGSGRKGFEVSPQNIAGTLLGTLIAGPGNHLTGGGKYVTQSSGNNANPAVWTFSWVAPQAGTGNVTFYGAFCVSEPVTKLSTLAVQEFVPLSIQASATPSQICAGDSSHLQASASGGSGNYTYSWTSIPPGFASGQQNPWVNPAITTQYVVSVNDGTGTATDTVQVSVTGAPFAYAGTDTTYCVDITEIPLQGTASNYASLLWTTSGDGTFSNTSGTNSIYYPGTGDKTSLSVYLSLTANPIAPCANPVTSTRHILFDPCSGIKGMNNNQFILSLFPNPSSGIIVLSLHGLHKENATIKISDIHGTIIFKEIFTAVEDINKSIDLTGFAKGVYLFKIETASTFRAEKIIIQ